MDEWILNGTVRPIIQAIDHSRMDAADAVIDSTGFLGTFASFGTPTTNATVSSVGNVRGWRIEAPRGIWATEAPRGIWSDVLDASEIEKILSPIDPEEFELNLAKDCKKRSDKLLDDFYAEYTNEKE